MAKGQAGRLGGIYRLALAILVAVALAGYLLFIATPDKQRLFDSMLERSLQLETAGFELKVDSDLLDLGMELGADFTADSALAGSGGLTAYSPTDAGIIRFISSVRTTGGESFIKVDEITVNGVRTEQIDETFEPVLGVWVKQGALIDSQPAPFGEIGLSIIPLSGLNEADRARALEIIRAHNVYQFDKSVVVKEKIDGKSAYRYKVTIERGDLARLGEIFPAEADDIDSLFAGRTSLTADVWIDARRGRLLRVSYQAPFNIGAYTAGDAAQITLDMNYGETVEVEMPASWISQEQQALLLSQ